MTVGVQQTLENLLCSLCDEFIHEESYHSETICEPCYHQYSCYCDSCGESAYDEDQLVRTQIRSLIDLGVQVNSFYYAEDACESICEDCVQRCADCGTAYRYDEGVEECCEPVHRNLHGYSYRPHYYYFSKKSGKPFIDGRATPGVLYMGVELEIAKMADLVDDFVENLEGIEKDFVYFKEDGSIGCDGAELVTMPATIDGFQSVFPFDALDSARQSGARSFGYTSCGFHIHVARSAFTATHMWKFIKFQLENPTLCQRVAQRDESSYASWYYDTHEKQDLPDYVKGKKANGRRYLAINFQNPTTVELRYFKGNILRGAIMKNLEFVQSVYDYTKQLSVSDVVMHHGLKAYKYYAWLIHQEGYDNLKYFFDNNGNRENE